MSNEMVLGNEFSVGGNIGMDEVVSVFVSKYESNLFERKDELGKKVKGVKGELVSVEKDVIGGVNVERFNQSISILNISSKVKKDGVSVDWNNENIVIDVEIEDGDSKGYGRSISKNVREKVKKSVVKKYGKLKEELSDLNDELMEVMGLIKSVSRKEREVRGRISELKLKESGYENLLENEGMLKLIQL